MQEIEENTTVLPVLGGPANSVMEDFRSPPCRIWSSSLKPVESLSASGVDVRSLSARMGWMDEYMTSLENSSSSCPLTLPVREKGIQVARAQSSLTLSRPREGNHRPSVSRTRPMSSQLLCVHQCYIIPAAMWSCVNRPWIVCWCLVPGVQPRSPWLGSPPDFRDQIKPRLPTSPRNLSSKNAYPRTLSTTIPGQQTIPLACWCPL